MRRRRLGHGQCWQIDQVTRDRHRTRHTYGNSVHRFRCDSMSRWPNYSGLQSRAYTATNHGCGCCSCTTRCLTGRRCDHHGVRLKRRRWWRWKRQLLGFWHLNARGRRWGRIKWGWSCDWRRLRRFIVVALGKLDRLVERLIVVPILWAVPFLLLFRESALKWHTIRLDLHLTNVANETKTPILRTLCRPE